jgi:hypothetical protein
VYCKAAPDVVYASTRYEWKRATVAAASDAPWTRVNNCTVGPANETPHWESSALWKAEYPPHDDSEYFANFDFSYFDSEECRNHYLKE